MIPAIKIADLIDSQETTPYAALLLTIALLIDNEDVQLHRIGMALLRKLPDLQR